MEWKQNSETQNTAWKKGKANWDCQEQAKHACLQDQ